MPSHLGVVPERAHPMHGLARLRALEQESGTGGGGELPVLREPRYRVVLELGVCDSEDAAEKLMAVYESLTIGKPGVEERKRHRIRRSDLEVQRVEGPGGPPERLP